MVLAESKNTINLSQITPQKNQSSQKDLARPISVQSNVIENDFYKIQENYMKSLEYNYQLIYKLRDAKIF